MLEVVTIVLVVAPCWIIEDMVIMVEDFLDDEVGLTEDVLAFLVEEVLVIFLLDEVLETFLADEELVFLEDVLDFLVDVLANLVTGIAADVLVFLEDVLDFLTEEELDFNED